MAKILCGWSVHEIATRFLVAAPRSFNADARTVDPKDFIISERRYPDRVGQTYAIGYNPKHKWFWFPRQERNEALVFKVYDSATDGRARWTAHTAFDDPTSTPASRPRESIEIRTLAFF